MDYVGALVVFQDASLSILMNMMLVGLFQTCSHVWDRGTMILVTIACHLGIETSGKMLGSTVDGEWGCRICYLLFLDDSSFFFFGGVIE